MAQFDVQKVRRQAGALFDGFTTGQKAMLAIAGLAVTIGLWTVTRSGGADMAPLYSNLSAEDASSVTDQLSSQGVAYELGDSGRTILVPSDKVYQLRLDMAADGLPTGGAAGYALLDKQGITTSQFRQRVDYQRALEGEISRTIGAIDGVEAATVHLVIPDDDVFAGDDKAATASVLVRTRSGQTLSPVQVQTIANLTASSVEGLTTKAVTVADGEGNLLLAPGQDGVSAAVGDTQSRQTNAFELALAGELEELIAPVVGSGKASIKVTADLDYDQRESTVTRYENPTADGQPALVIAGTESSETYTGGTGAVDGVLGVDGTPEADLATGGTAADGTSYAKSDTNRQYALNQVVEGVKTAPGKIVRLSVAALVDDGAVSPEALAQVQQVLSSGAGIDGTRGDVLTVQAMPFSTAAADAAREQLDAAAAAQRSEGTMSLVRTVLIALLVFVVLFLAWRNLRKAAKRRALDTTTVDVRELELVREHLQAIAPIEAGTTELPRSYAAAVEARGGLEPIPVPALARTAQQLEDEISDLIDRQPDEVATMLRSWLGERRTARR